MKISSFSWIRILFSFFCVARWELLLHNLRRNFWSSDNTQRMKSHRPTQFSLQCSAWKILPNLNSHGCWCRGFHQIFHYKMVPKACFELTQSKEPSIFLDDTDYGWILFLKLDVPSYKNVVCEKCCENFRCLVSSSIRVIGTACKRQWCHVCDYVEKSKFSSSTAKIFHIFSSSCSEMF